MIIKKKSAENWKASRADKGKVIQPLALAEGFGREWGEKYIFPSKEIEIDVVVVVVVVGENPLYTRILN